MKENPKKNPLQINSNCLIEKSKWNKVCELTIKLTTQNEMPEIRKRKRKKITQDLMLSLIHI